MARKGKLEEGGGGYITLLRLEKVLCSSLLVTWPAPGLVTAGDSTLVHVENE